MPTLSANVLTFEIYISLYIYLLVCIYIYEYEYKYMYLSLLKFFYNSYPPELSQKKKKKNISKEINTT